LDFQLRDLNLLVIKVIY